MDRRSVAKQPWKPSIEVLELEVDPNEITYGIMAMAHAVELERTCKLIGALPPGRRDIEVDEVYGDMNEKASQNLKQLGLLIEYITVKEKLLAIKPNNLDFTLPTIIHLAIETSHEGLERARFSVGKSILVLCGTGGVGSLVI
ncbi:hypothetical protein IEQ34_021189 [Dendrobium chrysotoxum]|uniref:Uncharacterized protein n=1 Tax=Dendrobium chrysotoxum TaxID=161865 RepID=A0AAV7G4V6_DENCH|nr:hypothetical protein IEQ34_021189 [Dendrobium chrysotoxum]